MLSTAYAENTEQESDKSIHQELQRELKLAEAEMAEDEELFMDEEDSSDDEFVDEGEDIVEEKTEPAPEPAPQETSPHMDPIEEMAETKPLPQPVAKKPTKPVPKAKPPTPKKVVKNSTKRVPASFKQGFKKTGQACHLYAKPNKGSSILLSTPVGKKLWLESAGSNWYKGYHKSGHGYFPADCF